MGKHQATEPKSLINDVQAKFHHLLHLAPARNELRGDKGGDGAVPILPRLGSQAGEMMIFRPGSPGGQVQPIGCGGSNIKRPCRPLLTVW